MSEHEVSQLRVDIKVCLMSLTACQYTLSTTWPQLNSDVGLEEGEY